VQLAEGIVVCDRARFVQALSQGDVDAVVAIYRGPFLAAEPRAGPEFERWVGSERLRLQAEYLRVMEGAVSAALQAGDFTPLNICQRSDARVTTSSTVKEVKSFLRNSFEPSELLW
jgi:DNA-binding SARP family transcriptional activator